MGVASLQLREIARGRILADILRADDLSRRCQALIRVPEGFERRIDTREGPWGCWPYQGRVSSQGYGMLCVHECGGSYMAGAHRVAYFLATGYWQWGATGRVIRHLCHNRRCCNPAHLLVGTRSDNAWDDRMRQQGVDLVAIRRDLVRGPFLPVVEVAA
jgi:hypothetical protein